VVSTSAAATPLRAGVIGIGQMGRGIARNLAAKGLLAAAWDIREETRREASTVLGAGIRILPPGALAACCDVIVFVVPGSADIEACLSGADGILAVDRPGQVIADLTTSQPDATRRLAALAASSGRGYLDAGMTGGAAGADAGRLSLMVGAEPAVLERCRPVLEAFTARVLHVGGPASGHTMKLIHNMVLHTTFLATSEGCRLAEQAGIQLETAIAVMNAGNARSFITEQRFPNHILSGRFDGRSTVSNLAKDLAMAARYARDRGTPGVYGPLTASLLAQAMADGLGDRDFTTLYLEMDRLLARAAEAFPQPDTP